MIDAAMSRAYEAGAAGESDECPIQRGIQILNEAISAKADLKTALELTGMGHFDINY